MATKTAQQKALPMAVESVYKTAVSKVEPKVEKKGNLKAGASVAQRVKQKVVVMECRMAAMWVA